MNSSVATDESLSIRSNRGLRNLVFWQSCLLVSQATVGYDEVLVGSLQTMPKWLEDMGNPSSSFLGLLVSVVFVGGFVGAFIAPPVSDRYGRRVCIFAGSTLCIIGTVLQSASQEREMFLVGRVIIGLGISFTTCGGPTLVNELSHPALRGKISSMFNVLWYVGSIFAAWITFGTSHMETSSWCWRIPSIVQAVPALFVACVVFLMPESPRYLYSRGLISEAEDVLTIYHANSDPTSPLVALELQEISAALSSESEFSKASFLSTLRSRENRRRYGICVAVALLTLWCGQGVISYYFSPILTSVGITSPIQQTGINGGMQIWNLLCSITGALLADRIGRRPLWLSSFSGMILFNVPLTITSAIYARRGTKSAANATVALLFLYNAAFNLACNPLLYTYTTEILPYSIRARGLGVQIAVSEAALTVNQYVNPIALDRIGYYYYIFYLGVLFVGLVMIYFFFPETKGKTLEELSGLFVETEIGLEGDVVEMKQDDSLSLVKDHVEAQVGTVAVIR